MEKKIIEGVKTTLSVITEDDTPFIVKWRNASHVKKMLFTQENLTIEQHNFWLKNYIDKGTCIQFIITNKSNRTPIGTTFLKNIDYEKREAEFGIFIGESEYLGQGIGTEATGLMLHFAFCTLNLKKIYLSVLESNIPAIEGYKKNGFLIIGADKNGYKRNEESFTVIKMHILYHT